MAENQFINQMKHTSLMNYIQYFPEFSGFKTQDAIKDVHAILNATLDNGGF